MVALKKFASEEKMLGSKSFGLIEIVLNNIGCQN